jgi:tetratricopeptide (TPR) repeat protein
MTEEPKVIAALERGETARREKRLDDARTAFAEAADVLRPTGSRADLAHALTRQAQIERDERLFAKALEYQLEALTIERTLNDRKRLAHTIRHVADILQDERRHAEAAPYYSEMLELYRTEAGVLPLEFANAIRSVALHNEYLGNKEQSLALWQEARDRYAALDALFLSLTGKSENPGVQEADRRLAALRR